MSVCTWVYVCAMCMCACPCVRVSACACVRVCVCACVSSCRSCDHLPCARNCSHSLTACFVLRSPFVPGTPKGCAFVEFHTSDMLRKALKLHHSTIPGHGDRKINLELTAGGASSCLHTTHAHTVYAHTTHHTHSHTTHSHTTYSHITHHTPHTTATHTCV